MKKLISILVVLMMTVVAQTPVVNQISQFVVGPTSVNDIKFWGDDIIVSRYSYETNPFLYYDQLILLDKFGEVIWSKEFAPRELGSRNNLVISNLFCIFTLGDSIYKINKEGQLLKKKFLNSTVVETALQPNGDIVALETNRGATPSRFFVYNEELDLIRTVTGQPGATYSVAQLGDAYFISGDKNGGGVVSSVSSHIARYDTTGSLLWVTQFPDAFRMRIVVNNGRLYFCGVSFTSSYKRMMYGELEKDSGDTLWTKMWGAPYPENFLTTANCSQIDPSPGGGFVVIGITTAPGQSWSDYNPNLKVGLMLGYVPGLDYSWVKTTSDFGNILSGDWKDSLLVVFGDLGQSPIVAKAIFYSVSGLTAIEIEDDELGINSLFLGQNYPNPFNPSTKIKFSLTEVGPVSLKVYDLLGSEVATLVNEELLAGEHEVSFEASSLASGVYIYTLRVGKHTEIRKMVLLK